MGSYYDFAIACDLKPDTPQQVIDTLKYMTRTEDYEFDDVPDHPLFEDRDWKTVLRNDYNKYSSFIFPGEAGSSFRLTTSPHMLKYTLHFRVQWKIDLFSELAKPLLEWLAPYSETEGFVGYFRNEYSDDPILIYFRNGKVKLLEVTEPKEPIINNSWRE